MYVHTYIYIYVQTYVSTYICMCQTSRFRVEWGSWCGATVCMYVFIHTYIHRVSGGNYTKSIVLIVQILRHAIASAGVLAA